MSDLWTARQRATGRQTAPQPAPTQPAPTNNLLPVPYGQRHDLPPSNDAPSDTPTRGSDTPIVAQWCANHHLPGYIVGRWVWVQFDSKPERETLDLLKSAGFTWIKTRGAWAHNCGHHSRRGKIDPRIKYGMIPVGSDDDE